VNIWREVVADGAGLAAPCDAAQFAQRIAELIDDPARLARMGEAGRASVAKRYDWASIGKRLEAVYAAIVAGKSVASCAS
jgi:glycosyltransferase involved in cell wall biosynthesis